MTPAPESVALVSEYPWRFGGAQRLLATLAQKWTTPIYEPEATVPSIVWDLPTLARMPVEPALFSVVVDTRNLRIFQNKINIKMCHSLGTIEAHRNNPRAHEVHWVTHRPRVAELCASLGFNFTHVENGLLPLLSPPDNLARTKKAKEVAIVSRLSPDRLPKSFVESLGTLKVPVHILGSIENHQEYLRLERALPSNCLLHPSDTPGGISETHKADTLSRCSVLLHYSAGGLRDHLEYAILDGLAHGCVPVCISSDPSQFRSLTSDGLGIAATSDDLAAGVQTALAEHSEFAGRIREFMIRFRNDQPALLERWSHAVAAAAAGG